MELNLEEDEEGDDGAHHDVDDGGGGSDPYATPTSRLPAHFLTSTPYQRHNGGGEPQESGDIENIENLKVLFTARGVENDRLRAEIERLAEHKEGEMRRLRHEAGFAKAENEKLSVEVEQAQQMYAALSEENQALRRDGEMLKASLDKQAKQTEDVS